MPGRGGRAVSMRAESADCPRDKGLAIRFGRTAPFKCRRCGFEFQKAKANKYNAKKAPGDGDKTFDSRLEVRYLRHLELRQAAGEIHSIRWKPRIEVDTDIFYKPEVTYYDIGMATDVTADAKGGATKGGRFPTICKLWRNHMDHPLHVVEQSARGLFKTTRKILPRGKERTP